MKLSKLSIKNLRSIKDTGEFPVSELFALIGENNTGKSNIMRAVEWLTTGGSGGTRREDFNDPALPIVVKGTFTGLATEEARRWRPYLVAGDLILEKQIWFEEQPEGKDKARAEFHGYKAEPKEWYLSIEKVLESEGTRPKWAEIAVAHDLPEYFFDGEKCNKTTYSAGLAKYLMENDVEYEEPDISATQALGLQSNVIASLPTVYMLSAITNYSDEIDRRASSTTFRRLMADLSDRILKRDERFQELQEAMGVVIRLLNDASGDTGSRLQSLSAIEERICELLQGLMPSVQGVCLSIEVDEMKDIFSRGVTLSVNDGVDTDVLAKGHGLQRCVVFTLLRALIMNQRGQLVGDAEGNETHPTIILQVEEPELYIHPQLAKLVFDAMRDFSETDQVIYSTHSPLFIDAFDYYRIGAVSKPGIEIGTQVKTCLPGAFDDLPDRKVFQGLTRLTPAVNEMFFARRVLIVEGPEDQIAVSAVLANEGRIEHRVEELDWSIIVAGGKQSIPFLQRVLNAFNRPYAVLHDLDLHKDLSPDNRAIQEKKNNAIEEQANGMPIHAFPVKLEESLGLDRKFKDQYDAFLYLSDPSHITEEVKTLVLRIFE